jgi:type IV pilus assembly protein PilE
MFAHPSARKPRHGVTLIELMITLAVVLIISAIAWPTFQEAVHKSRRADAMAGLARILHAQERWRSSNPAYQTALADLPGATATMTPDRHYDLTLVDGSVNATAYTARATVRSSSPQNSDNRCRAFQVAVNGGNITYTSEGSGGANAAPDPCWAR